jgi:hypothetical protein
MDDQQTSVAEPPRGARTRWGRPAAFAAAGLVAGGLLAGSLTASAADSGSTTTPASTSGSRPGTPPNGTGSTDPSQPQRSDEELLTGATADKVEKAALAKYPGATVVRIETDSDGVYEAHLTKADGTPVTVEVDKSFTVTGLEQGGFGGGHGRGLGGGDAPSTGTESGTATSGYAA